MIGLGLGLGLVGSLPLLGPYVLFISSIIQYVSQRQKVMPRIAIDGIDWMIELAEELSSPKLNCLSEVLAQLHF